MTSQPASKQLADHPRIRGGNGLVEIKIILDIELLCSGLFSFGIGAFQLVVMTLLFRYPRIAQVGILKMYSGKHSPRHSP